MMWRVAAGCRGGRRCHRSAAKLKSKRIADRIEGAAAPLAGMRDPERSEFMSACRIIVIAAFVAVVGAFRPAPAAEISGAGATFPYPIYAKWAEAYHAKTGTKLNYQSIGSGGGIKQIS